MKFTQSEMAEWLHLSSDRIVRAWEAGTYKIPGSVQKCFELAGKLCLILFILSGCTNNLYEVNKRINSYSYMDRNSKTPKTPAQFYADGGGNCLDYANVKKAELGGEIVILPEIVNGRTHAVLKVDGYILDSKYNEIDLAMLVKTYPYEGE